MKVQLKKSQLIFDIESGMTRVELAEKYNISAGQIKKALSMMGISDMKAKQIKFEIVEEEEDNDVEPTRVEPVIMRATDTQNTSEYSWQNQN